jgi:hypothetical protein
MMAPMDTNGTYVLGILGIYGVEITDLTMDPAWSNYHQKSDYCMYLQGSSWLCVGRPILGKTDAKRGPLILWKSYVQTSLL